MRPLLFLSITSALVAQGCSDDCGPSGAATTFPIPVSNATLTYGGFTAGANNDCPDPMAPSGVVSMTIQAMQTDGAGLLTLCIPRPDQLKSQQPFGSAVKIVDLTGSDANGCTYTFASGIPVAGGAKATGICDNGTNSAGFALVMDGAASLSFMCTTMSGTIPIGLKGVVAVAAQ